MIDVRMPFGKYRDRRIVDIPHDYLKWVIETVENLDPWVEAAIEQRLSPPETTALSTDVLRRARRVFAAKLHPDRGGSRAAMSLANQVIDWIESESIK